MAQVCSVLEIIEAVSAVAVFFSLQDNLVTPAD